MITLSRKRICLSLILKITVFVCAALGVILSATSSRSTFMGGSSVLMYFTIQSNILIALICLIGAILLLLRKPVNRAGQILKLSGTVAITLTGMVFCFVLVPFMSKGAWNPQNVLTHIVVPVTAVADLFVAGIASSYRGKDVLWGLVPPLLYVLYAGIAFAAGWQFSTGHNYPYFFLNWGSKAGAFGFCNELPFIGCVWWITALGIFLIAVTGLYIGILSRLKKRSIARSAS